MTEQKQNRIRLLVDWSLYLLMAALFYRFIGLVWDSAFGLIAGTLSLAVNFAFSYLADKTIRVRGPMYYFYRYLPFLIFVVVPVVYSVATMFTAEEGSTLDTIANTIWVVLNIFPILLLYFARRALVLPPPAVPDQDA